MGDNLWLLGMAAVILAVYFASLSPSIAGGDSGELVAEGCSLGTAHPPGYPLFTMMVYLLKRMADPAGIEVAYAVNISSAIMTTIAAYIMGKIVLSPGGNDKRSLPGALLSMGMFAFSPLIWQYAVTAEVFPINTLFASMLVYLVVRFQRDRCELIVCSGAFLSGIALCNQHTAVLYEAPLILWILYLHRGRIAARPALLAHYSVLFLLGISLYAYLPIAAKTVDSAGGWGDVKSFGGLIHHILRRDYGTFQLYSGKAGKQAEGMVERTVAYVEDLFSMQGLYVGPLLAAIGSIYWVRCNLWAANNASAVDAEEIVKAVEAVGTKSKAKLSGQSAAAVKGTIGESSKPNRKYKDAITSNDIAAYTPLAIAGTQIFYFLVFHSLSNLPLTDKLLYGVHQRFWMQPNVITFIWIGFGFNCLCEWIFRATDGPTKNKTGGLHSQSLVGNPHIYFLAIAVALGLVVAQCMRFYDIADQHDNMYFHNYARALLEPLPLNAVLLVNYDMQWTSIRYMQRCVGLRPDVTAINLSMMTFAWFKHNHHHYPQLVFPGSFYSSAPPLPAAVSRSTEHPFSMFDFLEANSNSRMKTTGAMGGIYLCGKLTFPDQRVGQMYETVPFGLTQTFIRKESGDTLLQAEVFYRKNYDAWKIVTTALPRLPDKHKFDEHTWEWTIGRDFADRVLDVSAYLLEQSIPLAASNSLPLMDAIYWLEVSMKLELAFMPTPGKPLAPPTSLLKNAGLGHAHLVQSKTVPLGEVAGEFAPSLSHDVFASILDSPIDWPVDRRGKEWSADKFVLHWGQFLARDDAKSDPQYATIRNMYQAATKTAAVDASGSSTAAGTGAKKKKKNVKKNP